MISVLSGKGGVGKSIIAFNLAYQIASLGYRLLLVDADVSSGNLHILTNAVCHSGIKQFASGQLSLGQAVTRVNGQMDILAASDPGPIPELEDVTAWARLMARLREQSSPYHGIIIDHSSGVSNHATVLAHASDLSLLVLVPELTSIADAYGLYKYLIQTNENIDCRLCVNRVQSEQEASYIHQRFGALADRFLGQVPALMCWMFEDPTVAAALAAQKPLAEVDPDGSAVQSLAALGREIVNDLLPSEPAGSMEMIKETTTVADIRG